jgi:NOL1/NOP2/sun family putative RNA methylase
MPLNFRESPAYFTPYNCAMPNTPPIPTLFLERMSRYLGDEFSAFAEAMEQSPVSGLRVNTLKLTPEQLKAIFPGEIGKPVAWCNSAFSLQTSTFSPGQHPYHLAGLYYLQDPSAMSPAEMLFSVPMHGRERVLDLAAAPGGKTTHLAALMQGRGLLVANEIKDKRVGHLIQNVERWGAGNVVITNETPERLADHFGAFFDRVLVDAPCSGEGMFRKDMGARVDWSPEMVAGCAVRQGNILRVAAKLVRPGGYLLYSTCTFAPEEDEGAIAQLMNEFPAFEVVKLPQVSGFMSGKPEWIEGKMKDERGLGGAIRLFPHRVAGEGHFACLLRKAGEREDAPAAKSDRFQYPNKAQLGFWRDFASATLDVDLSEDRFRAVGERLYYVPDEMTDFGRLRVPSPGIWLGSLKKDRFEPAHPLALFLRPGQIKNVTDFPATSREITGYLRGETLENNGQPGWTVVCADGWPLGWGKRVQGVVKNHFPRGWMV